MIRLIASDLDGTLLRNGAQELTPRALRLIHELTRKGICFAAASGRQYDNERLLFHDIQDEISYIAENGSLCVHNGKVISRGIMKEETVRKIMRDVKKKPGFELLVSKEDACFIEGGDPAFVNHIVNIMRNTTRIVPDITKVEGPILKLAVANMGGHDIHEYLSELREKFFPEVNVVTSGNIWIDFIVPGYNKGTALRKLMDLLDIRPEECMAFGDQYNDIEMLETAGVSYAMSDAAPGVAGHAARITDSVEDVLEDLLRQL